MNLLPTHASLFSGIGGFDLAAQRSGFVNVFNCEINPFCRRILKHYWPNAQQFEDITKTDFKKHANKIEVLTGGFPCQPFSQSGKKKGKDDSRYLWPEMLRAIREIQPNWIIAENVAGLLNQQGGLVFDQIITDLENQGYQVAPVLLPAVAVGQPQQRQRLWIIANANNIRFKTLQNEYCTSNKKSCNKKWQIEKRKWRNEKANGLDSPRNPFLQFTEMYGKPPIFSMDDELPFNLDGITVPKWIVESLAGSGNAIVPSIAQIFFDFIKECNESNHTI